MAAGLLYFCRIQQSGLSCNSHPFLHPSDALLYQPEGGGGRSMHPPKFCHPPPPLNPSQPRNRLRTSTVAKRQWGGGEGSCKGVISVGFHNKRGQVRTGVFHWQLDKKACNCHTGTSLFAKIVRKGNLHLQKSLLGVGCSSISHQGGISALLRHTHRPISRHKEVERRRGGQPITGHRLPLDRTIVIVS